MKSEIQHNKVVVFQGRASAQKAVCRNAARGRAKKVLVSLDIDKPPYGFTIMRGSAAEILPALAEKWLEEAEQGS